MLAGSLRLRQDVFVTGAVLGVHCNSLPLSFFPDIYNEDWFFFAREAAARDLRCAGYARQAEYDPFDSPERARREEFGDFLAEGLYALIDTADTGAHMYLMVLQRQRHIGRDLSMLAEMFSARQAVFSPDTQDHKVIGNIHAALASLKAAETQLNMITPDLCVSFIEDWLRDLNDWRKVLQRSKQHEKYPRHHEIPKSCNMDFGRGWYDRR